MSPHDPPPDPGAIRPDRRQFASEAPAPVVLPEGAITSEPEFAPPQRSAARPPHPGFWWSVLWCLGFLFVTQIPGSIVAVVILIVYNVLNPGEAKAFSSVDELMKSRIWSGALAAAFFVTEVLVIGVSLLVIRLVVGADWKRQLAVRRPSGPHLGLAVASLPGLVVLANAAFLLLKRVLPDLAQMFGMPNMEQMVSIFGTWPWPFGVLVIGLGPGLGEELWCRGFLGRGLVGRHGVVLGVIFSSFFFGLIHIDPCQGTMAMLMGLFLHFTYLATRSLWVPVLLHFLNNSLAVVESRIPALKTLDADPATAPLHLFAAAAVLLAVVIWALYTSRARLAPKEIGALWRPTAPGVEYPPEGSGIEVVHPRPSALAFGLTLLALAAFFVSCYAVMHDKWAHRAGLWRREGNRANRTENADLPSARTPLSIAVDRRGGILLSCLSVNGTHAHQDAHLEPGGSPSPHNGAEERLGLPSLASVATMAILPWMGKEHHG